MVTFPLPNVNTPQLFLIFQYVVLVTSFTPLFYPFICLSGQPLILNKMKRFCQRRHPVVPTPAIHGTKTKQMTKHTPRIFITTNHTDRGSFFKVVNWIVSIYDKSYSCCASLPRFFLKKSSTLFLISIVHKFPRQHQPESFSTGKDYRTWYIEYVHSLLIKDPDNKQTIF